jgi:hypothetical protein
MTLAKLLIPARRAPRPARAGTAFSRTGLSRTGLSRTGLAGAAVAAMALLAACGSVAAPGGGSGAGGAGGGTAPAAAPKGSLTMTVQNGPGKPINHWTLTCDPAGGTHPDAAAACRQLQAMKDPFATVKSTTVCPMILASARRATFTGTWFGQKVSRTIIDGGCDLGRWSALSQVMN